ncbi:MAG: hypothetical protein EZS28_051292, partial [Streblomastix strix]
MNINDNIGSAQSTRTQSSQTKKSRINNPQYRLLNSLILLLAKVTGYFFVEYNVQAKIPEVVIPAEMELHWEEKISRMKNGTDKEINQYAYYVDEDEDEDRQSNDAIEGMIMTKETLTLFSSTMQILQFNTSPVDNFLKSSNKKFLGEIKPVYLERVKKVMMENVETLASGHVSQSLKDVIDTVDSFRLDVSQQKYCIDNSMMPMLNCIHPSSIEAGMLMSQKEQRHNYLLSHPGPNGQILTPTQLQMRQIDER